MSVKTRCTSGPLRECPLRFFGLRPSGSRRSVSRVARRAPSRCARPPRRVDARRSRSRRCCCCLAVLRHPHSPASVGAVPLAMRGCFSQSQRCCLAEYILMRPRCCAAAMLRCCAAALCSCLAYIRVLRCRTHSTHPSCAALLVAPAISPGLRRPLRAGESAETPLPSPRLPTC